jgi:hypothetical protein
MITGKLTAGRSIRIYIGNYNRDFKVLEIIKNLVDSGAVVEKNFSLDARFYKLMKEGKIKIQFEDTVKPFSNDLHDAIFNLVHNGLISLNSPLAITSKGEWMLEDFILVRDGK